MTTLQSPMNETIGLAPVEVLPLHVVIMAGFIPTHTLPLYIEVSQRVRKLTVLLSTPMESDRPWTPQWDGLDVRVQRTWTFRRPRRHVLGFKDTTFVHIPWNTISLLRTLRPDVIVSSELGFRSLFSSLFRKVARSTPLIFWTGLSEHTEKGKGWHRHLLRKWLVHQADGALVNGRSGARYLERMGMRPEAIYQIAYSCLPNLFDQFPVERGPEASDRLLYVGRLIELKGLIPFLRALTQWSKRHPDRRVEFTIAGSGPQRAEIEAFRLPPGVSLKLLGECDYTRLAEVYRQAGIFVFPTLADDWGLCVNEAMTAGLPVLGSVYSQAVVELCSEGVTGWLFQADRKEQMDRALEAALATPPDALNQMRQAARARVADLTPAHGAEQLLEAVRGTLNAMKRQYGKDG